MYANVDHYSYRIHYRAEILSTSQNFIHNGNVRFTSPLKLLLIKSAVKSDVNKT